MASGEEACPFLSLPQEIIARILRFLGPEDLMAVERTTRELSRLARVSYVLQTTKFLPVYSPGTLRNYLDEGRAMAITELVLNDYLSAGSTTIEASVYGCVNLKTLRCINTRLLPTAVLRLLEDRLRGLKFLEWSILASSHHTSDVESFVWQPSDNDAPPMIPETLHGMYVEVIPTSGNVLFLCNILKRSSTLRDFHLHERRLCTRVETGAYKVLESLHEGTAGKFITFTFTDDSAAVVPGAGRPAAPEGLSPVHEPGSLLGVLEASLKISPSVIVRQNPRPTTNCAVIDRSTSRTVPQSFLDLFILMDDNPFATLEAATRIHHWHHNTRALTLKSSPVQTVARTCSESPTDSDSFLEFFRGCNGLTELNLASFHFEEAFNCCSILADAGLVGLRALALPSCALCGSGCLEQLARARFRLDELDVRNALTAPPVTCAVCNAPSTCTEEAFEGLSLLCSLKRLTLCDLPHVRNLRFLKDCVVRELRLRNLGRGCFSSEETAKALTEAVKHVHSFMWVSSIVPLEQSFVKRVLRNALQLRRLCIMSTGIKAIEWEDLLATLWPLFPAAEFIHAHCWIPGLGLAPIAVAVFRPIPPDGDDRAWYLESALSSDCVALCGARNLVSAPRPRNCGPRRF